MAYVRIAELAVARVMLNQNLPDSLGADIDLGISELRIALNMIEPGNYSTASINYNLAVALSMRAHRTDDQSDRLAALQAWKSAMHSVGSPTLDRARAAKSFAEATAAKGEWDPALSAYRLLIDLTDEDVLGGVRSIDRQELVARWSGVATDAAASALANELPASALEMLERGRGILWRSLLDMRTDIERLQSIQPAVANRLIEIRLSLEAGEARNGTVVQLITE
jgi:hypothetical protein